MNDTKSGLQAKKAKTWPKNVQKKENKYAIMLNSHQFYLFKWNVGMRVNALTMNEKYPHVIKRRTR